MIAKTHKRFAIQVQERSYNSIMLSSFWPFYLFTKRTRIKGIDTDLFYQIIEELKSDGWKVSLDYMGFDKGIDYDLYVLKKAGKRLKFSWAWGLEGEVIGNEDIVAQLAERYHLDR